MIRLRFRMAVVLTEPDPIQNSPCCHTGVNRHQSSERGLTDVRIGAVEIQRYKCKGSGKTFAVRPQGVTRSSVSDRLKAAAARRRLILCGRQFHWTWRPRHSQNARANYTRTGLTLLIHGSNASPSGIYQDGDPPTTGKEYAYELENDPESEGFNTWAITYS